MSVRFLGNSFLFWHHKHKKIISKLTQNKFEQKLDSKEE